MSENGETMAPTFELRYLNRIVTLYDGPLGSVAKCVLQQKWKGDKGTIEWVDVPEEIE